MLQGAAIRQSYLDFFRERAHKIVDSASVVPHDDPTLLFTNAGMNQFKPYFLGQANPEFKRIADTQKCIRVSGKHNDLEEVGHDTYHHTFFEMLGNWSFGDYYKKESIEWAWELFTQVWGLPKERLHATVYGGDESVPADEEAVELWRTCTDINPHHIHRCGRKDNFWMMGETGPCGPCSEVHIDLTPDLSGHSLVNAGSPLVMELWNLVFIQFNAEPDGSLRELPAKHVDTGMGFERACAVLECTNGGKDFNRSISNYDTEVFMPILRVLQQMSKAKYNPGISTDIESIAMRVIADHIRMVSFSIADGAIPSNEGRGYVVRRLLRRAARYARKIGLREPFLYELVPVLKREMGATFPELVREEDKLQKIIKAEEESFNQTLDRGLHLFDEVLKDVSGSTFPADAAFKLYDTYGFPTDLTEVMAREKGLSVDQDAVAALMQEQKSRARAAQTKHVVSAATEKLDLPPTPFVGYDQLSCEAEVVAVLGKQVVLSQTPFYGEMGGQLGDCGWLRFGGQALRVVNTTKAEGVVMHHLESTDGIEIGSGLVADVDLQRRRDIERHHSATHLLHWALREVLGTTVRQQGSLVAPDRLRFDFTHYQAMQPEEVAKVEAMVNQKILENHAIEWWEIDVKDKPDSVIAFFGDKYGQRVRVVKVGGDGQNFDGFSMELCGGTHTRATGQLGPFRLLSESAIAAGVRRVEAVCGTTGLSSIFEELAVSGRLSRKLGVPVSELENRVESMQEQQRQLSRQLEAMRRAQASLRAKELLATAESRDGLPFLVADLGEANAEYLKWVADTVREGFQGVAILAGVHSGRVALLVSVHESLQAKGLHAGKLVKELASRVGGGGGGRADLAEAGGKDPSKLKDALAAAGELIFAQAKS
jgi:alanyl-tRNA synthetase